jgi:hypothetical protein
MGVGFIRLTLFSLLIRQTNLISVTSEGLSIYCHQCGRFGSSLKSLKSDSANSAQIAHFAHLSAEMSGGKDGRNRRIDFLGRRETRWMPLKWHTCSGCEGECHRHAICACRCWKCKFRINRRDAEDAEIAE